MGHHGCHSSAAEAGQGEETGIVPSSHKALSSKPVELPLTQHIVCQIEAAVLPNNWQVHVYGLWYKGKGAASLAELCSQRFLSQNAANIQTFMGSAVLGHTKASLAGIMQVEWTSWHEQCSHHRSLMRQCGIAHNLAGQAYVALKAFQGPRRAFLSALYVRRSQCLGLTWSSQ